MSFPFERERTLVGIAAGAAAALLVTIAAETDTVRSFEARTVDLRLRAERSLDAGGIADSSIVIVDVDNRSLRLYRERLGRWPWSRDAYAAMLDFLAVGGPRLVAFDILLSEPDRSRPAADSAFQRAVAAGPATVQAAVFDSPLRGEDPREVRRRGGPAALARFALPLPDSLPAALERAAPLFAVVDPPLPGLLREAEGLGAINRAPDPDAVSRRELLLVRHEGRVYPAMALAIALGGRPGYSRLGIDAGRFTLDGRAIPLEDGRIRPHWRGGYGNRPYRVVPAWKILDAYASLARGSDPAVDPGSFADKDVIVGTSATGVADLAASPFGAMEPGVFLHATLLDTLRSGEFLRSLPNGWSIAVILLVSLLVGVTSAQFRGLGGGLATLLVAVAVVTGAGLVALVGAGWIVPVAGPTAGAILSWGGAMAGNYLTEGRRHRETRLAFGKFIPPDVVASIADRRDDLRREVVRKEVTILFSDVQNFTALAERLEPEAVVETLNEYLAAMVEIVFDQRGTLDKYVGDGVMAFFGAPLDDPDHAVHACRAALAMRARLEELNERWAAEGRPCLAIRIGIHTGEALVGFIGHEGRRLDYTAIGDAVNLASRLESLNKECGTTILISESTAERLDGRVSTTPVGERSIRGREGRIRVHTLDASQGNE